MGIQYAFCRNHLLSALSRDEHQRLWPHLEPVELMQGQSLIESGKASSHVYFPVDSIVSLQCFIDDGDSAEIAVVGAEGVVGIPLFLGGETTPSLAIVQCAGSAYRLKGQRLKDEFYRKGPLQGLLLRYALTLMNQVAQTAACNRHHTLDQQLCRWLLLRLDRLPTNELVVTHKQIANMLGVRRECVTESACKLKRAGLISYHRGHITVLDRPGLESRVCECYSIVKKEFDRLLSQPDTNILYQSQRYHVKAGRPAVQVTATDVQWAELNRRAPSQKGFADERL